MTTWGKSMNDDAAGSPPLAGITVLELGTMYAAPTAAFVRPRPCSALMDPCPAATES